ncbi:RNA-directed DNA polymerase, Non LTR Retrotransposon, partial [Trachipleistophora hominis]
VERICSCSGSKRGGLDFLDNYRGISLISTLCKIVTKICANRLSNFSEREKILIHKQAGFRKLEECIAHATSLYEIGRQRSLKGRATYAAFLDFSKVYDRVPTKVRLPN